jgi:hypothetical protein
MLTQMSVAEPVFEKDMTEISTKLRQLRRLRAGTELQPASLHLQSALQAAKCEPVGAAPEVSYIFIGIIIPTPN